MSYIQSLKEAIALIRLREEKHRHELSPAGLLLMKRARRAKEKDLVEAEK